MKHSVSAAWALLWAALVGVASCNTESEFTIENSSDCIVTGVTLGSLPRTVHTLNAKGEDSTYVVQVSGGYYPMYIDQRARLIYNGDSLPVNTNVNKVTFSTFSATGTLAIKSLATGEDSTFVATDSTDLRTPRQVTVIANDGVSRRTYELKVNVHKENGEEFRWTRMTEFVGWFAEDVEQRTLAADGFLYVFAKKKGLPALITVPTDRPAALQEEVFSIEGAEAATFDVRSVQRMGGMFYALAGGKIVASADGIAWTACGGDFTADALVAAGTKQLVAIAGGKFFASENGVDWTEQAADADGKMPTADYAAICIPSPTDPTFEDILLTGKCDGEPVVWKLNIDLTGAETFAWTYYPAAKDNPYNCPALQHPSMLPYDGASLLVGTPTAAGTNPVEFYLSLDNGRTWRADKYSAPKGMEKPESVSVAVDENHHIWMVCSGTGELWRGRLNRLGWTDVPGAFLKAQKR